MKNLADKGILKYFISDTTHTKTINIAEVGMKLMQQKYGKKCYYKSSEFNVNEYIKNVDNKNDFIYDPNIDRKMCMYIIDFTVAKVKMETWNTFLNMTFQYKKEAKL